VCPNANLNLNILSMVKKIPEILVHLLEDCLGGDPRFSYRAMFGWYGIYKDKKIFSLLCENQLYFKVWDANIEDYKKYGMQPFMYNKKWESCVMSYYELPEEVLEDREELEQWIERSLQVEGKKKVREDNDLNKRILEYLREIPRWKVSTYKRIGDRFWVHSRRVASVMKHNKNPDIYPCYKVISESGKIGGYSALNGVSSKIEKLESDGVKVVDGAIGEEYIV
jgi:DNA transformation protein and related proteins